MSRYFVALFVKHLANYDPDTFEVTNVVGKATKRYRVTVALSTETVQAGKLTTAQALVREIEFRSLRCGRRQFKVCNASVAGFNLLTTFRREHNELFDRAGSTLPRLWLSFSKTWNGPKADSSKGLGTGLHALQNFLTHLLDLHGPKPMLAPCHQGFEGFCSQDPQEIYC